MRVRFGTFAAIVFLLTACGHIMLPDFPQIEAKWKYTMTMREDEKTGLYRVSCLKRCFDITKAKRVTPDKCGMEDWTEEIWYVHPQECNTLDGFWVADWTGIDRDHLEKTKKMKGIIPYLKKIRRYAEDNLGMMVDKGKKLLEDR